MKILLSLFLITSFSFLAIPSQAKILHEGWYKVLSGQQHVGYLVQRYEYLDNKKQFKFTSFLKTNALGGNVTESISGLVTDSFVPVSYQYTTQIDKQAKLVDANFKNGTMTAKVTEDGKSTALHEDLKKSNPTLSVFLPFKILQSKQGLKKGLSASYHAIAEEDAKIFQGKIDVTEFEKVNGHDAFKVLNDFKNIKSISYISPLGEIISVKQPLSALQIQITQRAQATQGFPSSDKLIKSLFGSLPKDSPLTEPKAIEASSAKALPKDSSQANKTPEEALPSATLPEKQNNK